MAKITEAPETTELREASSAYTEIRTAMFALEEKLEEMKCARALAFTVGGGNMPENLRAKAAPYLKATSRPRRLATLMEQVQEEIDDLAPKLAEASQRLDASRQCETSRLAILLQPKHRAIVTRMARAMEELSAAIADERQLFADFATQAPLPQSGYLPNIGGRLGLGTLAEFDSPAWRWRKHVTSLKILEN